MATKETEVNDAAAKIAKPAKAAPKTASKAAPKKAVVKKAAPKKEAVNPAAAKPQPAAKSTKLTVVPFVPIAAEALRNINTKTPEFKTYYSAMETTMSNYKDQYEKFSGDASTAVRQGLESYVQMSTSMMKGAEVLMKTCMELAQDSAERNAAAMKNLMACRTLNEAAEQQNKIVQANLDEAMSAATKISEMAIKIGTEAFEPINQQVTKAMKKMSA